MELTLDRDTFQQLHQIFCIIDKIAVSETIGPTPFTLNPLFLRDFIAGLIILISSEFN